MAHKDGRRREACKDLPTRIPQCCESLVVPEHLSNCNRALVADVYAGKAVQWTKAKKVTNSQARVSEINRGDTTIRRYVRKYITIFWELRWDLIQCTQEKRTGWGGGQRRRAGARTERKVTHQGSPKLHQVGCIGLSMPSQQEQTHESSCRWLWMRCEAPGKAGSLIAVSTPGVPAQPRLPFGRVRTRLWARTGHARAATDLNKDCYTCVRLLISSRPGPLTPPIICGTKSPRGWKRLSL